MLLLVTVQHLSPPHLSLSLCLSIVHASSFTLLKRIFCHTWSNVEHCLTRMLLLTFISQDSVMRIRCWIDQRSRSYFPPGAKWTITSLYVGWSYFQVLVCRWLGFLPGASWVGGHIRVRGNWAEFLRMLTQGQNKLEIHLQELELYILNTVPMS